MSKKDADWKGTFDPDLRGAGRRSCSASGEEPELSISRRVVTVLAFVVLVAGCGTSGPAPDTTLDQASPTTTADQEAGDSTTEITGGTARPAPGVPDNPALDPATTAALLSDPATAVEGVWSVLANLGIGVYTPDAVAVLPGSERGPEDFFLFDFEVGLLAASAAAPSQPFSAFHSTFNALGIEISEENLLAEYRRIYLDEASGEWLPQLFAEMGMTFEPGGQLNRLQAWLLRLDALVPPNGRETESAAAPAIRVVLAAAGPCDGVRGQDADPAWGFVWLIAGPLSDAIEAARTATKVASAAANPAAALLDPQNLMHAAMIYMGTTVEIQPASARAHERHPGEPESPLEFELVATFDSGAVPEVVTSCMALLGFDVPPSGPVEGMGVEWAISDMLIQHGTSNLGGATRVLTDASGRSVMKWVPREEPAKGQGSESEAVGTVTATARIQKDDIFNLFAGLQEFLMPMEATSNVAVGWHDRGWRLTMVTWYGDPDDEYFEWTWEGDFFVDEENQIVGIGTGYINGASICRIEENGVVTYESDTLLYHGSFIFDIEGEQIGQDFKFRVHGREAEGEWLSKDEMCSGIQEMFGEFGPLIAEAISGHPDLGGYFQIPARDGASTVYNVEEFGDITITVRASF